MKNPEEIITMLAATPRLLEELINEIPPVQLKQHRIKNKWSIHEHACHIAIGDQYVFHPRLRAFINETDPTFTPYSGESFEKDFLIKMDLEKALINFKKLRMQSIELAKHFDRTQWQKESHHPEYSIYTPYIMLRHFLMHDYFHMYRIEELWLTTEEFI